MAAPNRGFVGNEETREAFGEVGDLEVTFGRPYGYSYWAVRALADML